ncbi:MAG: MBL fold metallo-hydrolase [bacterium]|nr:MBL fold metallo-hydrolase [bacterium]
MIIETLVVSPFQTNCYLAASEKTRNGVVIDPGDNVKYILNSIDKYKLNILKIINTHAHVDHVSGAAELKDKIKASFHLHKGDEQLLNALPMQAQMYGMFTKGAPVVDSYLEDGDKIEIDDIVLSVIHTPGHSPGGICLHGDGVLFSGDTLFADSIGRTDLPGGSYPQLIDSIKSRLLPLDPETVVYSGHGPSTTIGYEKKHNMFLLE